MRIGLTESRSARGTEQADGMLGGQLFGPGGNTTLEYWIDGRRMRAAWKAPQRKGPCRSRALLVDPSFFVSPHNRWRFLWLFPPVLHDFAPSSLRFREAASGRFLSQRRNLRKAKSKDFCPRQGDLSPDQVKLIVTRLGVTEQDVVDMNLV